MRRKLLDILRRLADLLLLRLLLHPTEHDGLWLGQQLFAASHGKGLTTNMTWQLRDGRYWTVPFSTWQRIVKLNIKLRYLLDRWDCDNGADLLRVLVSVVFGLNAVGTVLNSTHAFSVVVAEDGVYWYEWQTGEWVTGMTGLYTLDGARVEI